MKENNVSIEKIEELAEEYLNLLYNDIKFPLWQQEYMIRKGEWITIDGRWKANYTYTSYEVILTKEWLIRLLDAYCNYDWENGIGGNITSAIYHYAECCKYFKESIDYYICNVLNNK